jgi:hypothetical protein
MNLAQRILSIATFSLAASLPIQVSANSETVAAGMGASFNKTLTGRVGYFWSQADTKILLDSKNGRVGTDLSFEDDLGLQSSKGLSMADLIWRINLHHRIEATYTSLRRSGGRRLSADIDFGDEQFNIGADIHSTFESDIWRLSWGWSWFNDSKFEFGSLLGLHTTQIKAGIRTANGLVSEEETATIPLPTIGLQGTYAFTPDLHLRGWFQWFALEFDKYDGGIFNASLSLDYYAFDNIGFGLGYSYYDYDLKVSDGRHLDFNYEFHGPMAYLNFYF